MNNWSPGSRLYDYLHPNPIVPTADLFHSAEVTPVPPSPIILDIDGDGVETTGVKDGAYFDHNADGFAEQTGWVGSDDGLLVRDLNGNGQIDSGRELFGDQTLLNNGTRAANGFQALAELDANHDGKIDSADATFASLQVWKDLDGDGYTSSGELFSLADAGVQSINTGYAASATVDANGNAHKQIGSYTRTDGSTAAATDVWFKSDTAYTISEEWLDVPADVAALPDLQGYGTVYDLHQAMVRDTSGTLKSLLQSFIVETNAATRNSLFDQILFKWTGSDSIASGSRGGYFDARKLAVLEKFLGEGYNGVNGANPIAAASASLAQAYNNLFETFYGQVMTQSHLKGFFDLITYIWDETSQSLKGDLSALKADLESRFDAQNQVAVGVPLHEFVRVVNGMQAQSSFNLESLRANPEFRWWMDMDGLAIDGTGGNDNMTGSVQADYLRGGDGDDTIDGSAGNDLIYSGDGNDTITGSGGNDIIYGGAGSDSITDSVGNDLIYGGDGDDIIGDSGGDDNIDGGTGADVITDSAGNDLICGGDGNDTITDSNGSDTVEGGEGDDAISDYGSGTNILRGGAGNDKIYYSNTSQNVLEGGSGDDLIQINNSTLGNANYADTITGGLGNDRLLSGGNADTYVFNRGDGQDSINDYGYNINGSGIGADKVVFGAGIAVNDLGLSRSGNHLVVKINDPANGTATDQITIENWFGASTYQIESFKFADGTELNLANMLFLGTTANDTLTVTSTPAFISGNDGNDTINGGSGNDILEGGAGNDTLAGSGGNNLYNGGVGTDTLTGNTGNELFIGAAGNDTITTGTGADLIAFNRGDGLDTVAASTDADNTLSLGGGIRYADLSFSKSSNHLVLDTGNGESITFQNWFAATDNRSVVTLQVIAEVMSEFDANSTDPLLNKKVQAFDFAGLASRFDSELAVNPTLTSWSLMNALLDTHLSSSDDAALGGDLAYQYGRSGSLAGIGVTAAQEVISAAGFGSQAQVLRPLVSLQEGMVKLG